MMFSSFRLTLLSGDISSILMLVAVYAVVQMPYHKICYYSPASTVAVQQEVWCSKFSTGFIGKHWRQLMWTKHLGHLRQTRTCRSLQLHRSMNMLHTFKREREK